MGSVHHFDELPAELLGQIFQHFAEPEFKDLQTLESWKHEYNSPWRDCRSTLQRLRLVCRRFYNVATPLLFSYVTMSVEKDTIDAANKIAQQPHLASCIRGVLIHTGLYEKTIANSARLHQNRVLSELLEFLTYFIQRAQDTDTKGNQDLIDDFTSLFRNCHNISSAWGADISPEVRHMAARLDASWNSATKAENWAAMQRPLIDGHVYRNVLETSHELYKARRALQIHYLETGAFSDDLVACLAMLPNLETMEMDGKRRAPMNVGYILEKNDVEALGRFIEFGLQGAWKAPDAHRDAHVASMMTTLPAELHKAGIRLRTLRLNVFPTTFPLAGHRTGESHRLPNHEELMQNLAQATGSLESVTLNRYFETNRYWRDFSEDYVAAVLGSPVLGELEMLVPASQIVFGPAGREPTAQRVGRSLSAQAPRHLSRLTLTGLVLSEASLGAMLAGCREARLDGVRLQDGLWANVVDRVIDDRRTEKRTKPRKMKLHRVAGGEMGLLLLTEVVEKTQGEEYTKMGYGGTEPVVLLMAEEYLLGNPKVQKNPFREHKGNASYFKIRKWNESRETEV